MCGTGITGLARHWKNGRSTGLRVLAYHRVLDHLPPKDYKFDHELISATTGDFEWQIAHISQHYRPTTFAELENRLKQGEAPDDKAVIVTFDDGFDDNYYHAYPILKKYGVPATIFIATEYIGGNTPFWFDWLVYLGNHLDPRKMADLAGLDWNDQWSGREAQCAILRSIKRMWNPDRIKVLDQLDSLLDESIPRADYADSHAMSWDQVREMADNGIEIGSHTRSHPILSSLEREQKIDELVGSKEAIEREIGKECIAVAYPVGGSDEYDQETVEVASRAGYRFGLTYIAGASNLNNTNLFELQRLHVERYTSRARFEAMMAMPTLFSN